MSGVVTPLPAQAFLGRTVESGGVPHSPEVGSSAVSEQLGLFFIFDYARRIALTFNPLGDVEMKDTDTTEQLKRIEKILTLGFEVCAMQLSVLVAQNQKGAPLTEEEKFKAEKTASDLLTEHFSSLHTTKGKTGDNPFSQF